MIVTNLIDHKHNKTIGKMIFNIGEKICTINLDENELYYMAALTQILENLARKFDRDYTVNELRIDHCDQEYFNAIKQELLIKLNLSTKTL